MHLRCHFGIDTLSWARHGARVAGLDVSAPAVEANVYDAAEALGNRTFDVVYTGLGALIWLPDIRRWARVVADLLRSGGFLYLAEFFELLSEHDYTLFPAWSFLVKSGFDTYRLPKGMPKLPLMYSLRARKPPA